MRAKVQKTPTLAKRSQITVRYPIYIPSYGRATRVLTARMFAEHGVPFHIVVEPSQERAYKKIWGGAVLVLPEDGKGLVYARNWIKERSTLAGDARHWQFDDDVGYMLRLSKGYKIPVDPSIALAFAEDFTERYQNVALTSFNSEFWIMSGNGKAPLQWPPFYVNARAYTCFLIDNALTNQWRGRYNEDTDMTLQVLAAGWCTILLNAFLIWTPTTMKQKGGQLDIYKGEGRLKMARELERRWPGVVEVRRRFGRAQHFVRAHWKKFTTPLLLKKNAKSLKGKYEMVLEIVGKSPNAKKTREKILHG